MKRGDQAERQGLFIRDARPDELDEISLLLKAAYQQYENSIPPEAWQSYLEDIMDVRSRLEDAELIVAELSGHLAWGGYTIFAGTRIVGKRTLLAQRMGDRAIARCSSSISRARGWSGTYGRMHSQVS